jgi:hypothetical protein
MPPELLYEQDEFLMVAANEPLWLACPTTTSGKPAN